MIGEIPTLRDVARAPSVLLRERGQTAPPQAAMHTNRQGSIDDISHAIHASRAAFLRCQDQDGAWRYPLEGSSVLTEAYFLIAQRLLNLVSPATARQLVQRVRSQQLPNGGWPLYPGHDGHVSTTVEAYVALRMNDVPAQDPAIRRARIFLAAHGGLSQISGLTHTTLAVLGLRPWSAVPFMPIEILLLPRNSPVSLYSFVTFTRIHMVSVLALGELRSHVAGAPPQLAAELQDLTPSAPEHPAPRNASAFTRGAITQLGGYADWTRRLLSPAILRERSLQACKDYLLAHQEPDGTWGNYILSTLFGILTLRAMGYTKDHPVIRHGCDGLRSLLWQRGDDCLVQPCNSAVWSTALVSYCLHETGLTPTDPALARSANWLLHAQSRGTGSRATGSPESASNTWGFQEGNALCPDVDDTIAAVRAIFPVVQPHAQDSTDRCRLAETWALSMQNDDGGWSSFDRNCRSWWLEWIPFNDMRRAMTDPSTADLTGRMLEFLGVRGRRIGRPEVDAAVTWLQRNQNNDGSWFGRWGIAYIYGTWTALMGLAAVGVAPEDSTIRHAVRWLETHQNPDGGWGESCRSDTASTYVPLGRSTPSQTAWALMGLVSSQRAPTPAIMRGLDYLLRNQSPDGTWTEDYTTGAGFAGKLYLNYRFYKDVWPLQALGLTRRLLTSGAAWKM